MNMPINLTHKAATFAYDLDFRNLPADVLTVARRCVLDGLAVALAGSEQPAFDILHRHLKGFGGSPQARVISDTTSSLPAHHAALLNWLDWQAMPWTGTIRNWRSHRGAFTAS